MAHKQPKKKRTALFDPDNIRVSLESQRKATHSVREFIEGLVTFNLECETLSNLGEDEVLHIMACKLTIQGLYNLRKAIQHVPRNLTRVIDNVPLRSVFILDVFKSLSSSTIHNKMSTADVTLYTKILENNCPSFMSFEQTNKDIQCARFLSPPVSECTQCEKKLSMRNNASRATLFTLSGPIACLKVTLECRDCAIRFGICHFKDECGARFYPSKYEIEVIEASNVTYFHHDLYKWMPSLR